MDTRKILQYKTLFDVIAREVTDDDGNAVEVWYARDLQERLGYARWENFVIAIGRAMEACKTLGINIDDHFRGVTKMIELAKGAKREVLDFMLTRYSCYLIAQNGDPRKEEVAFAQSYFAVQTRKAEVSSLTHFAEAEFGNVNLLMLKQLKRTDMNTFLHTEDELRASVEEGTRQVEAGQFYTDAQVKQMLHQRNLQLA